MVKSFDFFFKLRMLGLMLFRYLTNSYSNIKTTIIQKIGSHNWIGFGVDYATLHNIVQIDSVFCHLACGRTLLIAVEKNLFTQCASKLIAIDLNLILWWYARLLIVGGVKYGSVKLIQCKALRYRSKTLLFCIFKEGPTTTITQLAAEGRAGKNEYLFRGCLLHGFFAPYAVGLCAME